MKLFFINIFLKLKLIYLIKFKSNSIKYRVKPSRNKPGWNLTFEDDFNTGEINKEIWRTDSYQGTRYNYSKSNDTVPNEYYSRGAFKYNSDSILLQATDNGIYRDIEGENLRIPHQVGHLDSSNYFMQSNGYFEVRAKMPKSPGMLISLKLISILDHPPEIDVFQVHTNDVKSFYNRVHWKKGKKEKYRNRSKKREVVDLSSRFYTYGVEWNDKYLKFYFQGRLVSMMKTPKNFIHPMHLSINSSIDNKFDNQIFPNYYEVDYVRAYKCSDI